MKLSAYYGDKSEMYDKDKYYDTVYASKVFTESVIADKIKTDKLIIGGSGFDLTIKLPDEIEHIYPDYSLYPQYDFAVGWMTRGCPRCDHSFCITPEKDGTKSVKVADLDEFWNGQKKIVLLDQNILACKDREDLLQQLAKSKSKVLFDGGTDIRFINEDMLNLLSGIRVEDFHFAWDNPKEDLYNKFKLFSNSRMFRKNYTTVYILTNYWSTVEEDLMRVYKLRELGFMPYIMIYDKHRYVKENGKWVKGVEKIFSTQQLIHFKTLQHMQRWCNSPRKMIKYIPKFEDYDNYKRWVNKGKPVPF
jgi:hypothetical protein